MNKFQTFQPNQLRQITQHLTRCMKKSLESDDFSSKMPTSFMLPSFIDRFPTGNEEGTFMVIDIGGTHVRFDLIALKKGCVPEFIHQTTLEIPLSLKKNSGYAFFSYIAKEIIAFLKDKPFVTNLPIPVGLTFSFPLKQQSINSGLILQWNKDFKGDDVLGMDPVLLLHQALEQEGHPNYVKITAMVNDAVATLLTGLYHAPNSKIGLILGTGANAAYVEWVKNITNPIRATPLTLERTILNTEFGSIDPRSIEEISFILTEFDYLLDQNSSNPGKQRFEKMVSARYLGELASYISNKENAPFLIDTKELSEIEALGSPRELAELAAAVSLRSAQLSACVLCALLTLVSHDPSERVSISIDGALFEKYHNYPEKLRNAMTEILNSTNFDLVLQKDASAIGAAIAAALYAEE